ncbi:serine/threonine-protein kinase [Actinomadura macrotermitis]|uniref:Serine/threonine-protein kinase PknD n=1 Tax=Actinomadura macrotermitis TaxID=2585200 RepID=A0A7K0BR60_9ACTN|nr:serine/threonine-protein kinase [Actinomadura macrotermitis]MQY03607.1 Serine/threonine-protein kinase PknD [Actinomadura macrotermitis]
MPDIAPLRPDDPRRVGAFALQGRLGAGGQGIVYLGTGPDGVQVAVKVLRTSIGEEDRARFVRELAVARRVARFCTAQVLDADVDGDRPYIVSEYVPGPSLARVVAERGPLPPAQLERLAIGTATALAAIHQAGIVHRDFKPGNVLLGEDGPRVIDFGVAKALDPGSTGSSAVVGTPSYMAPEQVGAAPVGPPADVWAWGVTIAFASAARPVFGADTIPAVMGRILHSEPDLSAVPEPLRPLVRAALAKDPAARPAAAELLMRLIGHGGGDAEILAEGRTLAATRWDAPPQTRVMPPPPVQPPPPPVKQGNRWLAPIAVSVVALLIAAGAVIWALTKDPGKPQARNTPRTGTSAQPTASDKPATPQLVVSPAGRVAVDAKKQAVVTLTAEGGPVDWTSNQTNVTMSRTYGTVRPGQPVQITLTALSGIAFVSFKAEGTPEQQVSLNGG